MSEAGGHNPRLPTTRSSERTLLQVSHPLLPPRMPHVVLPEAILLDFEKCPDSNKSIQGDLFEFDLRKSQFLSGIQRVVPGNCG